MRQDLTDITVLLDRSGSMENIRQDMEGGFNSFVEEQRKLPGNCSLTLIQFDDRYEREYTKPLAEVPPLNLVPRGWTALLDAIGRAINETGERLAVLPESERPAKVIFVIITDGHENASQIFPRHKIAEMIAHQREKYAWQFLFLGANQDAIATGGSMGISAGSSLTYSANAVGTRSSYDSLSACVSTMRTQGFNPNGDYFSKADRDAAAA
jgi:hypothetical protein